MKLLWFLHRWTNYNVVCHIVSFSCCQGKILSFHLLQVNYVGKAANIYDTGYQLNGSAYVISKYISNTWLWDRVRVSGGAYGGFCDLDTHSGKTVRHIAWHGVPITHCLEQKRSCNCYNINLTIGIQFMIFCRSVLLLIVSW
jgi:Zn-dependent M16 (insulinase) family peptidase